MLLDGRPTGVPQLETEQWEGSGEMCADDTKKGFWRYRRVDQWGVL